MTKVHLVNKNGHPETEVKVGQCDIEIRKATSNIRFITETGEILHVCMYNDGFEIQYTAGFGEVAYDSGPIRMKNGVVKLRIAETKYQNEPIYGFYG